MQRSTLRYFTISLALTATLGCGGSTDTSVSPGESSGVGGASGEGGAGGTGGQGATGGATVLGAGCELNVVAAGNLPQASLPVAHVTGPTIVATDTGFVLADREQYAADGMLAIRMLYVDDLGVVGTPSTFDLSGCSDETPDDGVVATYRAGTGLLATSLPNCDDTKGAGAVFIPFDTHGQAHDAAGPQNQAFQDISFARNAGVAASATPGEFEVVYRRVSDQVAIEHVVLEGSSFKSSVPILAPFGETDLPYGAIATSEQLRVLVAPHAGGITAHVGLLQADPGVDVPTTLDFPVDNQWATLTAWDNRFAIASPLAHGVKISLAAFEAGVASSLASGDFGTTAAQSAALATLGKYLFVAESNASAITLHRVDTTAAGPNLVATHTASMPSTLIQGLDGKHVAIAAARQRVAVVWLNRTELIPAMSTGGWALLECNP